MVFGEPVLVIPWKEPFVPNLLYNLNNLTLESVMRLDANKLSSAVRLAPFGRCDGDYAGVQAQTAITIPIRKASPENTW
jgi:hypothetical protein